jgi:hypothetical protein
MSILTTRGYGKEGCRVGMKVPRTGFKTDLLLFIINGLIDISSHSYSCMIIHEIQRDIFWSRKMYSFLIY